VADVRLVDLEVLKRFSLVLRREFADAEDVLAALDTSRSLVLAALGRPGPTRAAAKAPARPPAKTAAKGQAKAPAKAAPARGTAKTAGPAKAAAKAPAAGKAAPAKATAKGPGPVKAVPVKAAPVKAAPVKPAPAKPAPAKAGPAKAAPAKPGPAPLAKPAPGPPAKAAPGSPSRPAPQAGRAAPGSAPKGGQSRRAGKGAGGHAVAAAGSVPVDHRGVAVPEGSRRDQESGAGEASGPGQPRLVPVRPSGSPPDVGLRVGGAGVLRSGLAPGWSGPRLGGRVDPGGRRRCSGGGRVATETAPVDRSRS
jgi:hypothetical protein